MLSEGRQAFVRYCDIGEEMKTLRIFGGEAFVSMRTLLF